MKKYIITITTTTLVVLIFALGGYYYLSVNNNSNTTDENSQTVIKKENSSQNKESDTNNPVESLDSLRGKTPDNINTPTVINGILLANKKHPLPKNYNPGEDATAKQNVNQLIKDAQKRNLNVSNQVSGFRSYQTQTKLYNNYINEHGKKEADTFSARPGYSEHQTGLAFDLIDNDGQLLGSSGTSESSVQAARWLADNAHHYGFIIRYKPEFVNKTGYMAESWHIRYVGENIAKTIYEKNISLEEYLNALGGDYLE